VGLDVLRQSHSDPPHIKVSGQLWWERLLRYVQPMILARRSGRLARPYPSRFTSFTRVMSPSTRPVLHGSSTAAEPLNQVVRQGQLGV